jgi:hypothetical protein
MSRLNSLSKGYEEGSERTDVPLPTPQKRNHVSEVLTPTEEYYIENNITDNDILFIIENIKCLEGGTNYKGDVTHNPLTGRICNFIKINYEAEKLSLNNLNEITRGLNEILFTPTQNGKIIKDTPKVEEIKGPINLKTLSRYQEGSLRIKSDNPPKPYEGAPPKQIDPAYIVDSLKTFQSGGNLTEDAIKKIIAELNKLI